MFRFDEITVPIANAYLEVIIANNSANFTRVSLLNENTATPLTLDGVNIYMEETGIAKFVRSDDLVSQLDVSLADNIYTAKFSVDVASTATIRMARLALYFA